MKYYTWCNIIDHPKLAILEKSAKTFNINIHVLGKGIKWERNFQKIGLLLDAIENLDENELILCTDAFDVLYLQNSDTILKAYQTLCTKVKTDGAWASPIVFSAERLYSHHYPKYKAYWDAIPTPFGYKYLNSGTFIGYQKNLVTMLKQILKDAHNYTEKSDQKLYAEYAVKNPGKIILDYHCELFWCSAGEQEIMQNLYKIDSTNGGKILKNLRTNQNPCLVHITHSKGFYDQLLKIALEMGFINNNQKDKYWKLHKKSLTPSDKKPKQSPKQEKKGDKKVEKKGDGDTNKKKSTKEPRTKADKPTKVANKVPNRRSIYKKYVEDAGKKVLKHLEKKRRHHLISNGRVISECTTCYSNPHHHTIKKNQTSYNGGRFPSYF